MQHCYEDAYSKQPIRFQGIKRIRFEHRTSKPLIQITATIDSYAYIDYEIE